MARWRRLAIFRKAGAELPATLAAAAEADEPNIVERLILEAEIAAERMIGWVRLALSGWMFAILILSYIVIELLNLDMGMESVRELIQKVGFRTQIAFLLIGFLAVFVSTPKRWRPWMAFVFVTADAVLIAGALHSLFVHTGIDGSLVLVAPPIFAVPVMFALGSLRPRPAAQIYSVVLNSAFLLLIATLDARPQARSINPEIAILFELPADILRFSLLIACGLTIALGAYRTRKLLKRSVRESQRRKSLTRFLPAEIAPLVANDSGGMMRNGRRQIATVMFVDIRDSTARAEKLDPQRLSIFISSFRRRVMRAVEANKGIVDKFIGDGALILFGIEHEGEDLDGAEQALCCARRLLVLVERWNEKRNFSPPIRIGIGVHTGEVYVGVVGDERRLEFTVLGDSVNVAARLETLTKTVATPLLASRATIEAAGEVDTWEAVHDEPLRGRSGALVVLAPKGAAHWAGVPTAQPKPAAG